MLYQPTSFYAIIDKSGNIANITKNRLAAQQICTQNGLPINHAKQLFVLDEYIEHPKMQPTSDAIYDVSEGNVLVQQPIETKEESNETPNEPSKTE